MLRIDLEYKTLGVIGTGRIGQRRGSFAISAWSSTPTSHVAFEAVNRMLAMSVKNSFLARVPTSVVTSSTS
jgi:phosphoglycerate dehydrogenase-like enzyme